VASEFDEALIGFLLRENVSLRVQGAEWHTRGETGQKFIVTLMQGGNELVSDTGRAIAGEGESLDDAINRAVEALPDEMLANQPGVRGPWVQSDRGTVHPQSMTARAETTLAVKEAAKASFHNREEIKGAEECACYHCLETFPSAEVVEWADKDRTAVCPRCGIDAVIPRRVASDRLLRHMQAYWFKPHK